VINRAASTALPRAHERLRPRTLLPTSDTDKNIEILTLRHQLAILQGQIDKPRLTPPTGRTSPLSCTGYPPRLRRST